MTVSLNRAYSGYLAGTVVQLRTSTEAALVGNGLAAVSAAAITPGAVTTTETQGRAAVAIAAASVVITNSNVTAESKIWACVAQAAADGTALRVERIVPANGSFTIYVTAGATAATLVDWAILNPLGETPTN